MPALTDFDSSGLQVVMLARLTTGSGGVFYADGVNRTPAAGSLRAGSLTIDDPTTTQDGGPFTRIRYVDNQLNLNDNAAWNQQTYFAGDGNDLRIYIQTDAQVMSAPVSGNFAAGGNFVRISVPTAMQTFLAGIGSGADILIAFARPSGTAPVAQSAWRQRSFQGSTGYWLRVSWSAQLSGSPLFLLDATVNPAINEDLFNDNTYVGVVTAFRMNKNESGSVDATRSNGRMNLGSSFPTTKALFICAQGEFNKWEVDLVSNTNANSATMIVDFWNGNAWQSVGSLSDGTIIANTISFRSDGEVTWTIPQIVPPSFGSDTVANQSYRSGSPITALQLPVATGGTGSLVYSTSTLPRGLTFNARTRQIAGTPTNAGTTTVTYTVTDGNSATATLTFDVVITQDLMPGFGGATVPNQTYVQNAEITALQLPVASSGDPPLVYSVSTLPNGLQFNASNRRITGTPTNTGTTTVTYTVTDEDGDTDMLSFDIIVNAPTPTAVAPTVDITTPDQQISGGGRIQIASNVTGNPTPSLNWQASAGTISNTGIFTAPAAIRVQQTVIITLTATNSEGSDSDTVTFTIPTIPRFAPTVSITTVAQTLLGNQQIQIQADVDGFPTPTRQWRATAGRVTNTGLFIAPDATSAEQTVTVSLTATNSEGSTSDTVIFTISSRALPSPIVVSRSKVDTNFIVEIFNGEGIKIGRLESYETFAYRRSLNSVGDATFIVPRLHPLIRMMWTERQRTVPRRWRVQVTREITISRSGQESMIDSSVDWAGFIEGWSIERGGQDSSLNDKWQVHCAHINEILRDYHMLPPDLFATGNTDGTQINTGRTEAFDVRAGASESVIKAYVSAAIAAGVAHPSRARDDFRVEADGGAGVTTAFAAQFENLLEQLVRLADAGGIDFEVTIDPLDDRKYLFKTYHPYRGLDRRRDNGVNDEVVFSFGLTNIGSAKYETSMIGQHNALFLLGDGDGASRTIHPAYDTASISRWGRREFVEDSRGLDDETELITRGNALLEENRERETATIQVQESTNSVYGVNWDLGDLVTVDIPEWGVTMERQIRQVAVAFRSGQLVQAQVQVGDTPASVRNRLRSVQRELDNLRKR